MISTYQVEHNGRTYRVALAQRDGLVSVTATVTVHRQLVRGPRSVERSNTFYVSEADADKIRRHCLTDVLPVCTYLVTNDVLTITHLEASL